MNICVTENCPRRAEWVVQWPGKPVPMCAPCEERAQSIAKVMGFPLSVVPLPQTMGVDFAAGPDVEAIRLADDTGRSIIFHSGNELAAAFFSLQDEVTRLKELNRAMDRRVTDLIAEGERLEAALEQAYRDLPLYSELQAENARLEHDNAQWQQTYSEWGEENQIQFNRATQLEAENVRLQERERVAIECIEERRITEAKIGRAHV